MDSLPSVRKVDGVNVRNEGNANIPIKREKWSLLQFPSVRNEGNANAEKAIYRSSQAFMSSSVILYVHTSSHSYPPPA